MDPSLFWKKLLLDTSESKATDIHFAGGAVKLRINMGLIPYCELKNDYKTCLEFLASEEHLQILGEKGEVDFAGAHEGHRLRCNLYKTIKGICGAFRPLPNRSFPWNKMLLTREVMEVCTASKQGLVIVSGPTGSGKCLGRGTPVLKYSGEIVPVECIRPGDLLMGPDGTPRKVVCINTGTGPLYQITPNKGEPWVCNDNHIMTLKRSDAEIREGKIRYGGKLQAFEDPKLAKAMGYPDIIDVPIKNLIQRIPKKKPISQHWKLFRTPVDFQTPREVSLIPEEHFYYLGLWLGNETGKEISHWIESHCPKFQYPFSKEDFQREALQTKRLAGEQDAGRTQRKISNDPFTIREKGENFCIKGGNGENFWLKAFLKSCFRQPTEKKYSNPNYCEGEKIIPLWAKTATRSQRLQLLAGILDSDGSLGTNSFAFTNKTKELVESTAFITRSLGLWASPPTQKVTKGGSYWKTCISGNTNSIPTRIKKQKVNPLKQKEDVLKTGWQAKAIGNGEYFGFQIDGDGRFLLGDFTVTHNSTTLCSILDYINEKYSYHILTIEDPIEYIFENKKSMVNQREIGPHTGNFHVALRAAMRENPNVIFVGEIRDYETALTALHAAETGHLVFSTLHTKRVANTVSRIMEMAPPGAQSEIRNVIANNLLCVMCQRLLPRSDGSGIIPCREILIMNPAAANYIKEGKEKSLASVMNANREKGMIDWDSSLNQLFQEKLISKEIYEANQDKGNKI